MWSGKRKPHWEVNTWVGCCKRLLSGPKGTDVQAGHSPSTCCECPTRGTQTPLLLITLTASPATAGYILPALSQSSQWLCRVSTAIHCTGKLAEAQRSKGTCASHTGIDAGDRARLLAPQPTLLTLVPCACHCPGKSGSQDTWGKRSYKSQGFWESKRGLSYGILQCHFLKLPVCFLVIRSHHEFLR